MEREGQKDSSDTEDNQRGDDHLPSAGTVENLSKEWLCYTVDQDTKCGGYRNGGSVPAKLFAHRYYEHAEAVTGADYDKAYE